MSNSSLRGRRRSTSLVAATAALGLLVAACGSDDKKADETTTTTAAPVVTDAPSTTSGAPAAQSLDTNGDGKVVIGVATPGPRNDGGYYQALVDGVTTFSKENGFADPIVVDNIKQEEAASSLDALARQNVDMIAVGAGEIADPLPELTAKYSDVIWYCNCGAGFQQLPNLIQSGDDGAEMGYSAGVATGLLLKAADKDSAGFIGNNNFNFEIEAFKSFELGLKSVDDSFTATYVATGSFNDVAAATEAFNNLKAQGVGAVWPYLGGAHEPVVKLANEAGIITMSAGASNACDRTDLDYQIAVRFDAGDYLAPILEEIQAGTLKRGETRGFHVGVDPQGGAVICDPTSDQAAAMKEAFDLIASGDLNADFGAIKGEAYGG
ncbi:MAG TPA: BMP family ABC transporter substrate-binding protein [Ilumatobacteraceae bacterium]|nr:BMP family ABC transporter substrate-binding protein [Ilumatobacteraceae bacterium]